MPGRLKPAAAALLGWATDAAFPLWATTGFDFDHGRFEERLTLRAERLPDAPIRLLSQARQIYAYALAARRGWYPGAAVLVEQAFASMVRDYRGRDGRGGWIFSIARDGAVSDPRRDFYAQTFVLLAIASYVQATGKRQALALADETLAFIDRDLRAPQRRWLRGGLPPADGLRRQNPHMHLFEGLLSLWECSGDARYLTRAGELFGLFASRFFRPDPGILGEYFTADLQPADGVAGSLVEPGHHYEWIWLLRRFEQISGRSVQPYVDALYDFADRHGFDDAGLIVDAAARRRLPSRPIPAGLADRRGDQGQPGRSSIGAGPVGDKGRALAVLLRDHFLTSDPAGGWHDRLDHNGACLSRFMPASTLYHLACAIDELSQFATSPAELSA